MGLKETVGPEASGRDAVPTCTWESEASCAFKHLNPSGADRTHFPLPIPAPLLSSRAETC